MSAEELEREIHELRKEAVTAGRQMLDERRSGGQSDVSSFLLDRKRARKKSWK